MVRGVVELGDVGELYGVQAPHYVGFPLGELNMALVSTSRDLKLLGCCNAVLAVYNHELASLYFVPRSWPLLQELRVSINRGQVDLLPHLLVAQLHKLGFDALDNLRLKLPDDVLVSCGHELGNVDLEGLLAKDVAILALLPEVCLHLRKLLVVRH